MDEIAAIASDGGISRGVPTGFTDLDEVTNGLHPSKDARFRVAGHFCCPCGCQLRSAVLAGAVAVVLWCGARGIQHRARRWSERCGQTGTRKGPRKAP